MTGKGKRIALAALALGLLALAGAGWAVRDRVAEEWWLWKLESEDKDERRIAAKRLGEMKSVTAIPLLLQNMRLVRDGPGVRHGNSIEWHFAPYDEAIANVGASAIPILFESREYGNPDISLIAATSVMTIAPSIGLPAVPELRRALEDEDRFVQWVAATTLADMGVHAVHSVPYFVGALSDKESEDSRVGAAEALGKIALLPEISIPALLNLVQSDESVEVDVALWSLGQFRQEGATALISIVQGGRFPELARRGALFQLANLDPPAREAILVATSVLLTANRSEETRVNALHAIGWICMSEDTDFQSLYFRRAVEALKEASKQDDLEIREAAGQAMNEIQGELERRLSEDLSEENRGVLEKLQAAAAALKKIQGEER